MQEGMVSASEDQPRKGDALVAEQALEGNGVPFPYLRAGQLVSAQSHASQAPPFARFLRGAEPGHCPVHAHNPSKDGFYFLFDTPERYCEIQRPLEHLWDKRARSAMTREELMQRLSSNPRFRVLPTSDEGFVILAARSFDQPAQAQVVWG
jgi:hypothetical protein